MDFGATAESIIVKSSPKSKELADQNEAIQCAADLSECLYYYRALVAVESQGLLLKNWVPLPQGKMVLNEPLLSGGSAKLAR